MTGDVPPFPDIRLGLKPVQFYFTPSVVLTKAQVVSHRPLTKGENGCNPVPFIVGLR